MLTLNLTRDCGEPPPHVKTCTSSRILLRRGGTLARSAVLNLQGIEELPGGLVKNIDSWVPTAAHSALEHRDEAQQCAHFKSLLPEPGGSWYCRWFGEKHWQNGYELGLWRQKARTSVSALLFTRHVT